MQREYSENSEIQNYLQSIEPQIDYELNAIERRRHIRSLVSLLVVIGSLAIASLILISTKDVWLNWISATPSIVLGLIILSLLLNLVTITAETTSYLRKQAETKNLRAMMRNLFHTERARSEIAMTLLRISLEELSTHRNEEI